MAILDRAIRKNFYAYNFFRKFAPILCKFMILEDGFSILGSIKLEPNSEKILIDVGANDGTSIAMMRQFFPRIKIYAFEPLLSTTKRCAKLEKNGLLAWNKIALGREAGEIELHTPVINGQYFYQFSSANKDSILENTEKYLKFKKQRLEFISQVVPVRTLDSFRLHPMFIKIDVEGHELNVLEGAKNTIFQSRPVILLEINSMGNFSKIEIFMKSISYVLHDAYDFSSERNNYVFIHKSA